MAFTVGAIAAKDGSGATILGGLLALDQTGSGPWILGHSLVDGVAGSNRAGVDSSNQLRVVLASVPSHAVTNAGTFAVQAAATQSGTWTVQPGNTANTTAWKVDGSAVTQPVSLASVPSHAVTNAGTFAVQSAQSGTWTVQPGNTANTTAWKVDGSAVTQPVSLASVPSHAVTNAGTFAVQAAITAASSSVADGALVTLGAKADAKSTATDTTAVTLMQVAKQISASVQALVVALGSTAFDLGVGTDGIRTLRVAVDSSQTDGSDREIVAASQTDQVIGAVGAVGDFLSHVIVTPAAANCGVVTIKDGSTTVIPFAGGGTTALSNLIPFVIEVGHVSLNGAWKITTGANVTCVAVGKFTQES